jgi:hypothetical protein
MCSNPVEDGKRVMDHRVQRSEVSFCFTAFPCVGSAAQTVLGAHSVLPTLASVVSGSKADKFKYELLQVL